MQRLDASDERRVGRSVAEVAERLWISPGTMRRHLENVYAKLCVHTRTAAVRAFGPRS